MGSGLILLVSLACSTDLYAQSVSEESSCNFLRYKPLLNGSDLFSADFAVNEEQPPYPKIARDAKVEGTVQLQVLIDRNGKVQQACVVAGHPLLNQTARATAQR